MFKKIYIEITNICNLNCAFCPETKRVKQQMCISNFESIIKKIKGYTSLVCLHVKGEPLLHSNLKDILDILDKYHLNASITTNGTLLKDKLDILLSSPAVKQINISLHSLAQNNLDYDKYLNDIFLSTKKLKNITISYRLWNLSSYIDNSDEKIIKAIEKYYNVTNIKEHLIKDKYYKLDDNLFINEDLEFTWPSLNNKRIIEKGRCLALTSQIAILVSGIVVPCCLDNEGDIPLGNIFEESLDDILNKPLTKKIKENFSNNKITCDLCYTCGFLKRLEDKRKKS